MKNLTGIIRADGEFLKYLNTFYEAYRGEEALPIAVNGLSGGAESAFIAEASFEGARISGGAVLILAESEDAAEKLCTRLSLAGVRVAHYKRRDLIFYNIRASHDVDRERLSVLSSLIEGRVDVVVSTPSAAIQSTIPCEMLKKLSLSVKSGDIMPPEELVDRLAAMGFARVDTVESKGQFSRRGGIVDFFGGESEKPIRIEFFGDEIDRISYFDPLTQRTEMGCAMASLLPATEVMVSPLARARMLECVDELLALARLRQA